MLQISIARLESQSKSMLYMGTPCALFVFAVQDQTQLKNRQLFLELFMFVYPERSRRLKRVTKANRAISGQTKIGFQIRLNLKGEI